MRVLMIFCFTLIIQAFAPVNVHEKMNLRDAIAQKKIKLQAVHNPNSTHYSSPVLLKITNNTPGSLNIEIPVGYRFMPADSTEQPMLVVKPEMFVLQPNGKKEVALQAMCMAHSKHGPGEKTTYKLGAPVSNHIESLAKQINDIGAWGYEGQQAVWCLTDNEGPENISGADTAKASKLRVFICKTTGKKVPTAKVMDDYRYNYYAPIVHTEERIWGEYEFKFSQPKSIIIAMFNRQNTVVRELYKNDNEQPGSHIFKYEFDSSVYTDDAYKIMFIADGKVMLTRNLNMRDWRANHN